METESAIRHLVVLRGARSNESLIVVAACLRSVRRAIAALYPKQAHDDAIPRDKHGTSVCARMVRESGNNDVEPAGLA